MESLEMFSCSLLNEDETALSIVDPVTVGVELKPLATPSRSNSSSLLGTHTLEVQYSISFFKVLFDLCCYSLLW